jgi:hypothetical protein
VLCKRCGDKAKAEATTTGIQDFTRRTVELAEDGDHYPLAFDKPGTRSQKYNTVRNAIPGLNLPGPDASPTAV